MLYHKNPALRFGASLAVLSFATIASGVVAQDRDGSDDRNTSIDRIVVTAPGLDELDVVAGSKAVQGEELQRELDGQIGEILAKQPGVSATSFAPGASRPILRGLGGERVKVLIDGVGVIDVSNTSVDHAVSTEPLTIDRIEVLNGAAALLYGGQAIGGAVNIIDRRIPREVPEDGLRLDFIGEADTAFDLRSGGASLDVALGKQVVFHIDGAYRDTNDFTIPGAAVAPGLRDEVLALADEEEAEGAFDEAEEFREAALQEDVVPNTFTRTYSGNLGATVFAGESNLGFGIGIYDTRYGVPGRPGFEEHGHGEEGEEGEEGGGEDEGEEAVSIDLRQFRVDMRGALDLGDGIFSQLRTRVGFSDYTHTEFEGDEVGTVFETEGIEARAELVQRETDTLSGSFGVQYFFRDFEAIGAEAFVQPNRTNQFSVFTLQELDLSGFQIEGAARYESVEIDSQPLGIERDFDLFSGAVSLIAQPADDDGLRFGVTGSRSERAPGGEELFANGPHIATQQFEIGDPNLVTESALGLEGFVRGNVGPATVSLSVYKNWFDDFIFLQGTGEEEDGLPVFVILQQDADFFGVEGEVRVPLIGGDGFTLAADLRAEYIEAELDDGTNVPRIPPLGLLGALDAAVGGFDARVEVQYFGEQNDVSPFETATDDFTFVNASVGFDPLPGNDAIRLLLQADNIFDVTGRRHSSFTKDYVPLPGRNFKVSLRGKF